MPALMLFFALCAAVVLAAYGAYCITFRSPHKKQNDIFALPAGQAYLAGRTEMREMIAAAAEIPFEEVEITSYDGLRLAGQYYHVRHGAPLALCVHGYRATAIRDFCGGMPLLREMGCNVLLLHHRAQGKSEGHAITFGIKERFDILSWIEYANRRFGDTTPILLYGISMGAATVLMAAGLALPENVAGILADSPYTSPREIIRKVAGDMKLPPALAYPFVRLGALLFAGGIDPKDASAVTGAEGATVPITVIHGEADTFVPVEMSWEIAQANPAIALHTFPGAHHGISFMTDKPRYLAIVRQFMTDTLS